MAFTIIAITIAFINRPLIIFRFKFNIIGHAYFSPLFTQVTNSPYTRVEIPGPLSLSLLFFFFTYYLPRAARWPVAGPKNNCPPSRAPGAKDKLSRPLKIFGRRHQGGGRSAGHRVRRPAQGPARFNSPRIPLWAIIFIIIITFINKPSLFLF